MTDSTQELDEKRYNFQETPKNKAVQYDELDKILLKLTGSKGVNKSHSVVGEKRAEAKQAITSLIKELVVEAKPPVIDTPSRIKLYADGEGQMWYDRGQNDTIARFEQNLLKALEEV